MSDVEIVPPAFPTWCGCGNGEAHTHANGPSAWQYDRFRDAQIADLRARLVRIEELLKRVYHEL